MPVESLLFLATYTLGSVNRQAETTVYLLGTGGGSTPVTVPTTGQIYPRIINIKNG